MRKIRFIVAGCALLAAGFTAALAQEADIREISRVFRENRNGLKKYTWKSRLQVEIAGELKEVSFFTTEFGADGSVKRTAINNDPELIAAEMDEETRKKVGKPGKKTKEFNEDLRVLVSAYTDLNDEQLEILFRDGTLALGKDPNTYHVTAGSIFRVGDEVGLWVNGASKKPLRMTILTVLGGEPVKVDAHFKEMENGLCFPSHSTVETEIKEKKMIVRTRNFAFVPIGG